MSLHALVKTQDRDDGHDRSEHLDNTEPDMCEVRVVGCCAINICSQCNTSRCPDNDADGDELKHKVPCALWKLSDR
jgi:hypothetical protein